MQLSGINPNIFKRLCPASCIEHFFFSENYAKVSKTTLLK